MTPRQIEKNVNRAEEEYGVDASKVILLVQFKTGKQNRDDILRAIARGRVEPVAKVKKEMKGFVPAIYIHAGSVGYGLGDGDLCLSEGPGTGNCVQSGEIGYWRPDDLRWDTAEVIDVNMESQGEPDVETLVRVAEETATMRIARANRRY